MDPTMQIDVSLLLAVKNKLCDSGVPTDVAIGIIEPIIKEVRKLQRREKQNRAYGKRHKLISRFVFAYGRFTRYRGYTG